MAGKLIEGLVDISVTMGGPRLGWFSLSQVARHSLLWGQLIHPSIG